MLSIFGLQSMSMMGKVSGSGLDKASDVLMVTVEAMHVCSSWAYLLSHAPRSACMCQGGILGPGLLLWLEVKIDLLIGLGLFQNTRTALKGPSVRW